MYNVVSATDEPMVPKGHTPSKSAILHQAAAVKARENFKGKNPKRVTIRWKGGQETVDLQNIEIMPHQPTARDWSEIAMAMARKDPENIAHIRQEKLYAKYLGRKMRIVFTDYTTTCGVIIKTMNGKIRLDNTNWHAFEDIALLDDITNRPTRKPSSVPAIPRPLVPWGRDESTPNIRVDAIGCLGPTGGRGEGWTAEEMFRANASSSSFDVSLYTNVSVADVGSFKETSSYKRSKGRSRVRSRGGPRGRHERASRHPD